jgi:hypothetical protein
LKVFDNAHHDKEEEVEKKDVHGGDGEADLNAVNVTRSVTDDDDDDDDDDQVDPSIAVRNENIKAEKLKLFNSNSNGMQSSTTTTSPTAAAISVLESVRKAAIKSLGQTPKHRKIFTEVVPTCIMDKPLRTLPMEVWSECFPSIAMKMSLERKSSPSSTSSTSSGAAAAGVLLFEDRVKSVSVLCVKESDLTKSCLTASFLAWLMKLNHNVHDPKKTSPRNSPVKGKMSSTNDSSSELDVFSDNIRCKMLSLTFTVISLPATDAATTASVTSVSNPASRNNDGDLLQAIFVPLSEPPEYSQEASAV